ncbi:MAG: tRNA (adenosine(37)-N6)-threonylcarbamoyltransferase complex dimerization subunit type 1 TsaB [Bacteroidota bacterium]
MDDGLILSLETSTPVCSVALHRAGVLLGEQSYHLDKSHSSLLPSILEQLVANCGYTMKNLDGFAISGGPGSYTGMRIGLSTAKGVCYALEIPLLSVGTLDVLVAQAREWLPAAALIAPMLDARRMEVYTLLEDKEGTEIWPLQALILEADSFGGFRDRPLYLVGNGAAKCDGFIDHPDLHIVTTDPSAVALGGLAWEKFIKEEFEDLAYFEPNYLKAFQTKPPSNKFKP